jgi:hypothetical protein
VRRRRIAGDARLAADAVDALRDGDDGVGLLYSDLTGDCDDHDGAVLWPGVGAAIAAIATAANATAAARAIEFDAEDLLLGGGGGGGETASHTTPFARCTPFLKDFSRRRSSPALPFRRLTGETFD